MIAAAVVDASVAAKWVLDEPGSHEARLLSEASLEAPELLLVECTNILWKKVTLKDLPPGGAMARLELLRRAPVSLVPHGDLVEPALRLSLELKHPVYDCIYLALALQRRIPLVTADQKFARLAGRRRSLRPFVYSLDQLAAGHRLK